ncbi:MAG: aldo/keto reductase, partial [Myxococcota bacterium]|nr:aldo/keto reductase [Myxococcota bacterium]
VEEIRTAQAIVPVVSVQNRCNPLDRRAYFDGVIELCEEQGLAFLPYSPVGGGRDKGSVGTHPVLNEVGTACGATAYEVALAWLLATSPVMLPIPGASRQTSARSSARAGSLELAPEHLGRLAQVFPTGSRP